VQLEGVVVRGVVSQGCQPIGEPLTITKVQNDLVYAVGGRPAYDVLVEAVEGLPEAEKAEARGNIMAGLAASEYVEDFRRGDFWCGTSLGEIRRVGRCDWGRCRGWGRPCSFRSGSGMLRMRT
jgi:small ligand-binding sensory domain FIST